MAAGKTLAEFSADLAAIQARLDGRALAEIPRGDHVARAGWHANRATSPIDTGR